MTELKTNNVNIGQIQIADEVIAIIAGTAALEVDGVVGMSGNFTGDIAEILGKKNLSKGVKVVVEENEVKIDINMLIKFGFKIHEVCVEIQKRVKNAVETMTGLEASEVNVNVTAIHFEKEKIKETNEQEKE